MMRSPVVLIVCFILLFACDPEKKEQDLQNEVIEKHDEIMPLMGKIMHQKNELQDKIDSLNTTGGANDQQVEDLRSLIEQLRKADSAMMTWMREYKAVKDSTVTHEERMNYLRNEKDKINRVQQMMEEAIEKAESY